MIELSRKSTHCVSGLIIALLGYAVAINLENSLGSHRYTVVSENPDGSQSRFDCLNMVAGVTREMELERKPTMAKITREKMNIVSKWYKCGVL